MKRLPVILLVLALFAFSTFTPAQAQRGHYGRRGYYRPGLPVYRPYGPPAYYGRPYAVPRYYHAPPYRPYGGRYYYRPRPSYRRPGASVRIRL